MVLVIVGIFVELCGRVEHVMRHGMVRDSFTSMRMASSEALVPWARSKGVYRWTENGQHSYYMSLQLVHKVSI